MYRSRLLDAVNSHQHLLAVLAVALFVRLVLAVIVQARVDTPPTRLCLISGDAEGYWELAQKIVSGQNYAIYEPPRYVLRVPGFPLLLAASQSLFGLNPLAARCVLAVVGTLACALTYWLGLELADSTTALIGTVYTALSPTLALFSVMILSETTFALALLASLIGIARFVRNSPPKSTAIHVLGAAVITGVLIGIATLVRPTWLYVGLAIAGGALLTKRQSGSATIRNLGLAGGGLLLGVVLSLAPWTYRNYVVTGHVVPTTLWVGPSLYDGLHPGATGDSDMQFVEDDHLLARMSEYEMDREYRHRAWEFLIDHPVQAARLALVKQSRYWSLFPNAAQFQNRLVQWGVFITMLPLFLFSGIGLWKRRRDPGFLMLCFGPVLLFAAIHLLFVGSLRYRLPAEYPLAIAAAIGVRSLLDRDGSRSAVSG
jgi:4-amino-4-deoxy-L-arabinose transferase-like glycosyltransferase